MFDAIACGTDDSAVAPKAVRYTGSWKAHLDLVIAALLTILTAPLILGLMVLTKLTSRGPALYAQYRLGLDGRPYKILKMRTMVYDCERQSGPRWSTPGDPRVTPLGRFLRASHLDELPQLWNILRGEMSLVGPRPERPEFVDQLERVLPNYRDRLGVRPGITGLAQVHLAPDTDMESVRRKLVYDLYYTQNVSIGMDLLLVLSTACTLVGIPFDCSIKYLHLPSKEVIEKCGLNLAESGKAASQVLSS